MIQPWTERRKEVREEAKGELKIVVPLPRRLEIKGILADVSFSGFRAKHAYPAFSVGQKVEILLRDDGAPALVVWNRIFEEHVETGFFVLQD